MSTVCLITVLMQMYFYYIYMYIADTCSLKESIKIPEVVSCQQKLNLHLQKWNLAHCGYSNANDLKLETDLERCLLAFTSIDTLDQDNKFICQTCSCGTIIAYNSSY